MAPLCKGSCHSRPKAAMTEGLSPFRPQPHFNLRTQPPHLLSLRARLRAWQSVSCSTILQYPPYFRRPRTIPQFLHSFIRLHFFIPKNSAPHPDRMRGRELFRELSSCFDVLHEVFLRFFFIAHVSIDPGSIAITLNGTGVRISQHIFPGFQSFQGEFQSFR